MGRPQVPLKASRTDMVSTRKLGGLMDRKDQKTESFNWVGKEKQQRIKEKGSRRTSKRGKGEGGDSRSEFELRKRMRLRERSYGNG